MCVSVASNTYNNSTPTHSPTQKHKRSTVQGQLFAQAVYSVPGRELGAVQLGAWLRHSYTTCFNQKREGGIQATGMLDAPRSCMDFKYSVQAGTRVAAATARVA